MKSLAWIAPSLFVKRDVLGQKMGGGCEFGISGRESCFQNFGLRSSPIFLVVLFSILNSLPSRI